MFGNGSKEDAEKAGEYFSSRVVQRRERSLMLLEAYSNRQQTKFGAIQQLVELRDKQAEKITTILSDYTEIVNQVSVVATLTLGSAVGLYSVLIGSESYFHPEWKHLLLCISSIITISFSIISVIESFFLGVNIDQVEAKFVAGVYPHLNPERDYIRVFKGDILKNINATFNLILITFFTSFISFAFSLLGVAYIGMGRSNSLWNLDERTITNEFKGGIFTENITGETVSDIEPGFISAVWTVNSIILLTYIFILWRFFESHAGNIHARSLLRFAILCSCAKDNDRIQDVNMNNPIDYSAEKFNMLQDMITDKVDDWNLAYAKLAKHIADVLDMPGRKLSSKERRSVQSIRSKILILATRENSMSTMKLLENWEKDMDLISEVERAYDKITCGSEFDLILAAQQNALEQLYSNFAILRTYLDVESPFRTVETQFTLKPYSKCLHFFLTLWVITGGFAVTLLMFVLSVPMYPFYYVYSLCRYGKAKNNICQYVSEWTLAHLVWLREVQTDFFEKIEIETDRTKKMEDLSYFFRVGNRLIKKARRGKKWVGKKPRTDGTAKYYDSVSLKL